MSHFKTFRFFFYPRVKSGEYQSVISHGYLTMAS